MDDESRFLDLCRRRCSVRRFDDRPVEREKIETCLEAARLAPSAENGQPWRFVVFDEPERKQALAETVFTGIFKPSANLGEAPVIIALLIKENLILNRGAQAVQGTPYQLVDAGIAGEDFALAAAEQGLGTCWVPYLKVTVIIEASVNIEKPTSKI